MKVTRSQVFARGITSRCPNCGGRTLFQKGRPFAFNKDCPACGMKLERDEGSFLASMSLNYGVTLFGYLLPVLLLAYYDAIPVSWAVGLALAGSLAVPVLLYRPSRSWWLMNYYLFLPHHLPANQRRTAADGDANT